MATKSFIDGMVKGDAQVKKLTKPLIKRAKIAVGYARGTEINNKTMLDNGMKIRKADDEEKTLPIKSGKDAIENMYDVFNTHYYTVLPNSFTSRGIYNVEDEVLAVSIGMRNADYKILKKNDQTNGFHDAQDFVYKITLLGEEPTGGHKVIRRFDIIGRGRQGMYKENGRPSYTDEYPLLNLSVGTTCDGHIGHVKIQRPNEAHPDLDFKLVLNYKDHIKKYVDEPLNKILKTGKRTTTEMWAMMAMKLAKVKSSLADTCQKEDATTARRKAAERLKQTEEAHTLAGLLQGKKKTT